MGSTPRMTNQIARQVSSAGQDRGRSAPDAWIGGVVASVNGGLDARYQIYLDTQDYVFANSTIDSPIEEGDLVYVVRSGSDPFSGCVIVGLQ